MRRQLRKNQIVYARRSRFVRYGVITEVYPRSGFLGYSWQRIEVHWQDEEYPDDDLFRDEVRALIISLSN